MNKPELVEVDGFEPPRPSWVQDLQSRAIDRYAIPPKLYMVRPVGLEPATKGL